MLINNQRWKIATHVGHKASWTLSGMIPPSATFPTFKNETSSNSTNLQLSISTRRWRTCLELKMDNGGIERLMPWRHSVLHFIWQLWWKWEGEWGFCWDSCKYVFSLRYCHTGIADLQWVVVSQGWKMNIYFVISFPTWQILKLNASILLFPA